MSTAITDGIRIQVESAFMPDRSEPRARRWFFAYTVTIQNEGDAPARLRARHWVIDDAEGRTEHVIGEGVVGQQPRLEPGEAFQYQSFCVLKTSHGLMRGTYEMVRDDGATFEADIPPFALFIPELVN